MEARRRCHHYLQEPGQFCLHTCFNLSVGGLKREGPICTGWASRGSKRSSHERLHKCVTYGLLTVRRVKQLSRDALNVSCAASMRGRMLSTRGRPSPRALYVVSLLTSEAIRSSSWLLASTAPASAPPWPPSCFCKPSSS
eukprot:scaffold978_cov392-Prasinococcus_capsulatus_cf.AAC.28